MYSSAFCKVYNEFGWNYFPEAFAEQLLEWLKRNRVTVKNSLDLACGTGVLCEVLHQHGIKASGMDFSEGMIEIARAHDSEIEYEVADMITYRPDRQFDLVTCTGDALNHIISLSDVEQIFRNVHGYLNEDGYFIFDILSEKEIPPEEPIDLDFSEDVKAQFAVFRDEENRIHLKTAVYENGKLEFEEEITETVHDVDKICGLLRECGFEVIKCDHQLLDDAKTQVATWYVVAKKL